MSGWTTQEHCDQSPLGCRVTQSNPPAVPDKCGRAPATGTGVCSISAYTLLGNEHRIVYFLIPIPKHVFGVNPAAVLIYHHQEQAPCWSTFVWDCRRVASSDSAPVQQTVETLCSSTAPAPDDDKSRQRLD